MFWIIYLVCFIVCMTGNIVALRKGLLKQKNWHDDMPEPLKFCLLFFASIVPILNFFATMILISIGFYCLVKPKNKGE